jgi:hypothetical protein
LSSQDLKEVEAIIAGKAPLGAINAEHWTRRFE